MAAWAAGKLATLLGRSSALALGNFGAIFGASLLAVLDALGIQRATHNVVAHAWQVFNAATANKDYRVFLKVVALARNVSGNFHTVRQAHAGNFAKRRVRFLGGH